MEIIISQTSERENVYKLCKKPVSRNKIVWFVSPKTITTVMCLYHKRSSKNSKSFWKGVTHEL